MTPESIVDHRAGRHLSVTWADGRRVDLSYRALRSHCMCADCRVGRAGADNAAEPWGALIPEDLELTGVHPIGHYALQLAFSDGHDRGIYPWSMLRDLGSG